MKIPGRIESSKARKWKVQDRYFGVGPGPGALVMMFENHRGVDVLRSPDGNSNVEVQSTMPDDLFEVFLKKKER